MARGGARIVASSLALVILGLLVWWLAGSSAPPAPGSGTGTTPATRTGTDAQGADRTDATASGDGSGAASGAADGTAGEEAVDPDAPVIRGRVVDTSGRPVPGAQVRSLEVSQGLSGFDFLRILRELDTEEPFREQVTGDAEGRFTLRRTPAGSWRLLARAKGFADRYTDVLPLRPLPPAEGAEIEVVVAPGYALEGHVENAAGEPVAGAKVVVFPQPRGNVPLLEKSHTLTGADGSFRFESVTPGRHIALASTPGQPMRMSDRVEVPAKEPLVIRFDGTAVLALTVVDGTGVGVEGAEVFMASGMSGAAGAFARGSTDAAGKVRLEGLSAGRPEMLMVSAKGFVPFSPMSPEFREMRKVEFTAGNVTEWLVTLRRGAEVRGRVLARGTGAPIAGAKVRALGGGFPMAMGNEDTVSGADGSFVIVGVAEGTSMLMAEAPGYGQPLDLSAFRPGRGGEEGEYSVTIGEGVTSVEKDILLDAAARIRGVVRDPAGEPVAGATVEVDGGERGFSPMAAAMPATTTASDGTFLLESVPAHGPVSLRAGSAGYLPGYAKEIKLVSGEEKAEVNIDLRSGSVVTGRVLGAGGAPIEGAMVNGAVENQRWQLENGRGGTLPVRTDGDGRFRIVAVEAGKFLVRAVATGHVPATEPVEVPEAGEAEVTITLPTAVDLEGRVVDEAGSPVPEAQVAVRPQEKADNSALRPQSARTDGEGRFRVVDLPRDVAVAVTASSEDHLPTEMNDVKPGGAPVIIRVRLGLRISGTVVDEAGVPQPGLSVWASGTERRVRGQTDESGRFLLRGLPPGKVELRLGGETTSPDLVLLPYPDVDAGTEGLVWTLARGVEITGTAVDQNGKPAGGLRVRAAPLSGDADGPTSTSSATERTGDDGTFRLRRLMPGRYRLSASGGGYLPSATVEVTAPGDPVRLTVKLGEVIDGTVVDAEGKPVGRSRVALRRGTTILWSFTSNEGAFEFEGLEPGPVDLAVADSSLGSVKSDDTRVTWIPANAGDRNVRLVK